MVKTITLAVWICAATIGGMFLSKVDFSQGENLISAEVSDPVKTKVIAVPILQDSKVTGYFLSRFEYAIFKNSTAADIPLDALLRHAMHAAVHDLQLTPDRYFDDATRTSIEKAIGEYLVSALGPKSVASITVIETNILFRSKS